MYNIYIMFVSVEAYTRHKTRAPTKRCHTPRMPAEWQPARYHRAPARRQPDAPIVIAREQAHLRST